MSLCAYMLVKTDRDAAEFVKPARAIEGVKLAHALFGSLDAIVVVEVPDMAALEKVGATIHGVPGLRTADTRIARSG